MELGYTYFIILAASVKHFSNCTILFDDKTLFTNFSLLYGIYFFIFILTRYLYGIAQ